MLKYYYFIVNYINKSYVGAFSSDDFFKQKSQGAVSGNLILLYVSFKHLLCQGW